MKLTYDNELYAVHRDGRRLYLPVYDQSGNVIPSGLPMVAISIDQDGKTFPDGATHIRNKHGHVTKGWTLVHRSEKPSNSAHFSHCLQPKVANYESVEVG